jgi:hypothetical protein
MSIELHRDKLIGYAYESTEGTDPIASGGGTPYYEFGKLTKTFGNFPSKEFKVLAIHHGSRDPTLNITHALPKGAIAFAPVNGVPWYQFLGSSSTAATIHTITGIDTGELPFITARFESQNSSENIRKSLVGAKINNINFQLLNANTRIRLPAMIGMGIQGMDVKAPTNTATQTPIFPDSEEGLYYVDSNFIFTWDLNGTPITEYKNQLLDFKYIGTNTNIFGTVGNTLTPVRVLEGPRNHILMFQLLRGGSTRIYDDYLAQTRSSTGKDLRVKIYNSAANYLQLDFNDVFIETCEMNDGYQASGDLEIYDVVASCEDLIVKSKDGLTAATFYGE